MTGDGGTSGGRRTVARQGKGTRATAAGRRRAGALVIRGDEVIDEAIGAGTLARQLVRCNPLRDRQFRVTAMARRGVRARVAGRVSALDVAVVRHNGRRYGVSGQVRFVVTN